MALKDKLPVSYLLFTNRGRVNRFTYWIVSLFIWTSFYILYNLLEVISHTSTWIIYPLLFWALTATATKRLHDTNKSGHWLWLVAVPVFGPLVILWFLGFRKGQPSTNRFGDVPGSAPDYYKNGPAESINNNSTSERIVDDVTRINPIRVMKVETPSSIGELQRLIKNAPGAVSIGGGRFSMGGQTASAGSTHIDMRKLNKVIAFSKEDKTIKVEAGMRWCDIQRLVDAHDLSIKIMQTYANFTVGGALSVNCHGRYIGLGPVILSVRSIEVILANGTLVKASQDENNELFFACIGCYNSVAVIATADFDLADNLTVQRVHKTMKRTLYKDFFCEEVRKNDEVIFHNADLYPPLYKNARAVSWIKSDKQPTVKARLMPLVDAYPIERYFISAFSKSDFGKWRRQYIIEPIFYLNKKVHRRNYEAGYDVAELEPNNRNNNTYVLQEYFIPVKKFDEFSSYLTEIFQRYRVNVLNVSVRHALKDPGSLLAWAKEESFAFVVWYKQGTDEIAKNKVAVWTRELIDAALACDGSYYLPYQVHATAAQFHKAYPGAKKLFKLKEKLDPGFKFRNVLWDTYYKKIEHE